MALPEALRAIRKNATQQEVANAIGLSRQSYQQYEAGTRDPDTETLARIADYFNVTTDYLLGRTDDPQTKKSPAEAGDWLSERELKALDVLTKMSDKDFAEIMMLAEFKLENMEDNAQ